ncbi:hypothetical protein M9H77_17265 [Catharanthus roseus]|uniref:Uncharacterized protein n=1 Tax=Catharanthus roseus TaxID=4058 RepID=A0ACC0B448_CATRO|nr:hypothetical protein M9H77_17265 [Catharanthus roseus]
MEGFDPFVPGGIASHRIAVGMLDILASLFHLCVCPPQCLYKGLRMGNIEILLLLSELCGMVLQLLRSNYLGPHIINRIRDTSNKRYIEELSKIPEKLAFYDYIGIQRKEDYSGWALWITGME